MKPSFDRMAKLSAEHPYAGPSACSPRFFKSACVAPLLGFAENLGYGNCAKCGLPPCALLGAR
jgi:hypothetical protein